MEHRDLRKDFVNCTSEHCIEENFNRIQDMYGYDYSYSYDNSGYEDGVEMFFKHLNPDGYFKVSDTVPAYEDIIGATYGINTKPFEVTEDDIEWIVDDKVLSVFDKVIVVLEDCDCQRNHYFKGVYFALPEGMLNSLSKTIRKCIDPKFSPVPDWNASEGEEGHIKNRTHYERTIVHDFVTEIIVPSGTSLADGYGTLPNLKIPIRNVVMPEGKYILIRLGGEELKLTALPPNVGGSRPAYREDITLNNGVTIRIMLTTDVPGTHLGDRDNYYYNVMPLPDGAEVPYIGQTYSVSLCEDELKQLDPKFLPEGIGGGAFVVKFTDTSGDGDFTADKTTDEIMEAHNDGLPVLGVVKGLGTLNFSVDIEDGDIWFSNSTGRLLGANKVISIVTFMINPEDQSVTFEMMDSTLS